jgi:hypothetical protein
MSDSPIAGALRKVRQAVHRLVHPEHAEEREQIERLTRAVRTSGAAHGDLIERLTRQVEGVSERMARDRDLREIDRRVESLRDASARQHHTLAQALKFASWDEALRIDERRLAHRLKRLEKSQQPVLVGPWTGEVGFELLYWIPFVTWALRQARVAPERILIVSRGGPTSWYAHLGGQYLDVLSYVSADQFRAKTQEKIKQRTMGPFDREIVRRMIGEAGLGRPILLHPGLMYRMFFPFWKQKATVRRIEAYTHYERFAAPSCPELAGRLPADYVAVRFYFSSCFPDTPDNRAFVETAVRGLAESVDVVVLNTSFEVDDHRDFLPGRSSRIHTIGDLMTPERNLNLQTAVIAGAKAFVGTYGGYSYLAPLCGVPSLAFYSRREEFFSHHLELAERVFRSMKAGSLVPLDVRDVGLLRMAIGSAAGQPSERAVRHTT